MSASPLPRHETFRCAACPGPADCLPTFTSFKLASAHSLKSHLVSLERAVQASTMLPTTLTVFVCKLCPVHMDSWCLTENQIKKHIADTHSQFFVKMWKEFSQLQCRVCDLVIGENTIEDHMDSCHPSDLFAKTDPLLVEERSLPGMKVDQNQNIGCLDGVNKMKYSDIDDCPSRESDDNESNLKEILKEEMILEDSPVKLGSQLGQKIKLENLENGPQMIPSKPEIHMKSMDLLLDQKKVKEASCMGEISSSKDIKSVGMKSSELNPYQAVMIGIKKEVSVGNIRQFFSAENVDVTSVFVSSGSGVVTFKDKKDAEAYNGKVIQVDNCSIRFRTTFSKEQLNDDLNALFLSGISMDISLDDLHDFFWANLCVIDNIIFNWNGQGKVVFRLRADADFWAGKFIAIKDAKIKLEKRVWDDGTSSEGGNSHKNQSRRSRSRSEGGRDHSGYRNKISRGSKGYHRDKSGDKWGR